MTNEIFIIEWMNPKDGTWIATEWNDLDYDYEPYTAGFDRKQFAVRECEKISNEAGNNNQYRVVEFARKGIVQ